jgi:type VI secretion system secreted protein VgrG
VTAALREEGQRHFHGFVTRFGLGARQGRHFGYRVTVSPWLWFLTRSTDCRIFQDMTVEEIVKKVFKDYGFADFEFKLFRSYRKWVHCVQYRESDFNFVARMLEHEGIYWWFEHTDTAHKLILVDSQSAHDAAPGCEKLPFIEQGAQTSPDTDCVYDWNYAQQVRSGKFALTSYDFERPSTDLKVDAEQPRDHAQADLEVFDWQGDYIQKADGTQLVEDRRDELQTPWETFRGSSNAQGVEAGRLIEITNHARGDFNGEYVVTTVQHQAWGDGRESGQEAGGYSCEFTAIRSSQQFRPQRRTPKPFVQGPQTAVVVGPSGEEIFTDKYGRVKLHFHWDRESKKNEKSSCWVRVSHPWAGKNFGIVDIPRIGQEVVVDFLEGDPTSRSSPAASTTPSRCRPGTFRPTPRSRASSPRPRRAAPTATPTPSASRTRRAASSSGSTPRRTRTSRSRTTRPTGSGTTGPRRSTTTRPSTSSTTGPRRSTTTRRSRSA